jgi:hypothetical protein
MLVCVDNRYHDSPLHLKINYLTILEERIGGNVLNSFCGFRACHQFSQMTAATQWIAPRKAQARLS